MLNVDYFYSYASRWTLLVDYQKFRESDKLDLLGLLRYPFCFSLYAFECMSSD